MRTLGIIKVPERIARSSACIAVCIYRFCTEVGQKQTALQYWVYLHPGQREGVNVITTDVCLWGGGVKDHMHRVRETSYN